MVVASQRFVQHARPVWLSPKESVSSMLLGGDDWLGAPLGVPEVVFFLGGRVRDKTKRKHSAERECVSNTLSLCYVFCIFFFCNML